MCSSSAASQGEAGGRDPLSIPAEVKASIRILVVDDDRTLRQGCASVLQLDGYNVTFIGRGDEALEVVRRRKVDIVLPDLPRQLRSAANLGEPAVVAIAGYRKVIAELSRAVAGAGLLDSLAASTPPESAIKRNGWFRSRKTK